MASESKSLEKDAAFMDKFSRQIGAYGLEAMAKLVTMRVLIVGVKGVGIEAAKNLALAGPGAITLCDNTSVELHHLGANFFLREADVGKTIAASVVPRLKELNDKLRYNVVEELSEDVVGAHDIVLFTEGTRPELRRWNEFCRSRKIKVPDERGGDVEKAHPIAFVACLTYGLSGFIFSDFGPEFTVRDLNGEAPATRIITNISSEKEGVVTLLPQHEGGRMHGIEESDHDGWVEFSDVKGMFAKDEETHAQLGLNINKSGPWRVRHTTKKIRRKGKEVTVFDGFRLKIGDTSNLSPYMGGGILTQVKKPVTLKHRSYSQNLLQPVAPGEWGLLFTDGAKFGRGEQLHIAFMGVQAFQELNERLPAANNEDDVAEVVKLAKAYNDSARGVNGACGDGTALALEELEKAVIEQVARHADVEVQPVACFFGGVVAQEIVKLTGKYTPLNQSVYLDFFEALPDAKPADTAPVGSRHDDHIAVWGKAFQEKLANSRTFMVGCGALGCELLKNFAMLGFATGEKGLITTTDNDRIEVSNLARQFLFRESNVGQPKAVASRASAIEMNPAIKIEAKEILVEPKTETTFNDSFWKSLDFVTNALDNVKARNYVDSRCVFFGKALLESGTLGTKCNSLPIVPHKTQSYTDGPKDGDNEDEIPMCTLRNFPSLIEHCIEWARAQFTDFFVEPASAAMAFCDAPGEFLERIDGDLKAAGGGTRATKVAKALPKLRSVRRMLEAADGATMEKCVQMAQTIFFENFRDKILNLTAAFPEDHKDAEGQPFWSGAKRFPTAAELDLDDELHQTFIIATANILACNFGVNPSPPEYFVPDDDDHRNPAYIARVLGGAKPPAFKRSTSQVATNEEEDDKADDADEEELEGLLSYLRGLDVSGKHITPADFEKDDDRNFHIDFIAAASNLRARNYSIQQATRHKCKMIAGKIIPAIATTTAAVTGLVMLEMFKVLQDKPLEAYKTSSNNLGTNAFLFSEPLPPSKAKKEYNDIDMCDVTPIPMGFTKWDKFTIEGAGLTGKQFIEQLNKRVSDQAPEGVETLNCEFLGHPASGREGTKGFGQFLVPGCSDADLELPLRELVVKVYGEDALPAGATFIPFDATFEDDDGDIYSVPPVVYTW